MTQPPTTTCQCTISYHIVKKPNGGLVAVWDQEPVPVLQMLFGRCDRCKLPFHTEFSTEEPNV
jgi:hypothetical protein